MKTLQWLLCVFGLSVVGVIAGESAVKSGDGKLRIGTYDSRVIAMAYFSSEVYNASEGKAVARCNDEMTKAKASEDKMQVADVEAKYKDLIQTQIRRHKQVYSTAPIDDLLLLMKDQIPAIAKAAGVGPIVSQWDKNALKQYEDAERVDVTLPMAKALHPTDDQLKAALDLRKQNPIPLEEAEKMDRTKD